MQLALALGLIAISIAAVAFFIYACAVTSTPHPEEDHEYSLSLAGARRREADATRAAGGAVPALSAREPGPRDPAIGVDQARAEVRARIHRYNRREVRHGDR
jgi:hypothetical protein